MTDTRPLSDQETEALGARATFREIRQQPEVWQLAAQAVRDRRAEIDAFLAPVLATSGLRIVLTGAGTSAFIGGVVAPTVARATGRRVDSIATTDLVSNPRQLLAEDVPTLLVSFARSGNSPESVAATRLADEVLQHVHHLVITCDPSGALAGQHVGRPDSLVLTTPAASNDAGFAMTSSFTSMLLTALLVLLGDAPSTVDALARVGRSVIDEHWTRLAALAEQPIRRLVFLGSGALAALAQEAALKVLELTAGSVVSYHDSALGFRHGPKAVLDEDTMAIVFVSTDPYTREYDLDIVDELTAALPQGRVLAVSTSPHPGVEVVETPGLEGVADGYVAVAAIVAAQILALSFALAVGTTPDNPFPGGSVNRVVQGVRIHPLDGTGIRSGAAR